MYLRINCVENLTLDRKDIRIKYALNTYTGDETTPFDLVSTNQNITGTSSSQSFEIYFESFLSVFV